MEDLRTFQFDKDAQQRLGAVLSIARMLILNPPIPTIDGSRSIAVFNSAATEILAVALVLLHGPTTPRKFQAMSDEERKAGMDESIEFINKLGIDLLAELVREEDASV